MEIISGEEPKNKNSFVKDENPYFKPWGMDVNQYCMLMHFAQFAGFVIPLGGFILPIIMWTTNKDQSQLVDQHGKNILNWMLSFIIYIIISAILIFVLIGIPLLIALSICSLVFTIIGALKASNGEVYRYPFTITFFN